LINKKVLLLLGVLVAGCPNPEFDHNPRTPEPFTDDDPTYCKAGCDRLRELGCPEGAPLIYDDDDHLCQLDSECESGKCIRGSCTESCEDVCIDLIKKGRFMGAKCWRDIRACEEIETVCRR
jgi:hypothetical protein